MRCEKHKFISVYSISSFLRHQFEFECIMFDTLTQIAKFRQQMKVQGVKPNGFTYNLIVEAAVRGRNPQLAYS